jgi:hypothetical protein
VWLLDVDGVINASRPGWSERPNHGEAVAHGVPWTMRWSSSMVRQIRQIATSGSVEVIWATTWCPWADQLEAMFGLPKMPRAFTADDLDARPGHELKLEAALAVARQGGRLIWTDDDAVPEGGTARAALEAAGALLISPDRRYGLQPTDIQLIHERLNLWQSIRD